MQVRARRRTFRMPTGESAFTRLSRVKKMIDEYKNGGQPSKTLVLRALVEYHNLLNSLWLWGLKKK